MNRHDFTGILSQGKGIRFWAALTLLAVFCPAMEASPKRVAFFSSSGEMVDYVRTHANRSSVSIDVFPAADAKAFAKALSGGYKIYFFHTTGENAEDLEGRVDLIRASDLRAQAGVVADVVDPAALREMCSRRSVVFVDIRDDSYGVAAEKRRCALAVLHWCASNDDGIDFRLVVDDERRLTERRTRRLHDSKWGVFNHYLGSGIKTAEEWRRKVEAFDVKLMADQLEACGAKFLFFTVMQGLRWMCAPSAAFDRIGCTKPGEACSVRDLPMELAVELERRGIDLYLYYTGDGPYADADLGPKFGLTRARYFGVNESFVRNWAGVLEELSVRYGDKVKGWWIDGCYGATFLRYTDELMSYYDRAVKKGNPDALIACNGGVRDYYFKHYRNEDFTCGEFNDFYCVPKERFIGGAQAFALIPLGKADGWSAGWGRPGCKRSSEYVANYVRMVNDNGGVVAIDVMVMPDGSWDAEQFKVLKAVGRATGTLRDTEDRTQ